MTLNGIGVDSLRGELRRWFGYDDFKAGQLDAIGQVMSGGHAVLLAPTGNGKSLCYQLPALLQPGLTLVVSPLIALMQDQVESLKARGIEAEFLNSQLSWQERRLVQNNVRSGRTKLLYVSPERLVSSENLRNALPSLNVRLLAIDEAHCISEWGHDFREDYRELWQVRELLPSTPVIALTATATERTLGDIVGQLRLSNGDVKTVKVSLNRENLRYEVRRKPGHPEAVAMLAAEIRALGGASAIVYCATRNGTEEVAEALKRFGIDAEFYHAGIEAERASKQADFMESRTQVVVATVAFGMGIDKDDIRLVVHWDMPKSVEAYYQETGRAGRDGKDAKCLLLYSPEAANTQRFFARQHSEPAIREHANQNVDRIQNLCVTSLCRRRVMLLHFGETAPDDCGGCDNCTDQRRRVDVTDLARSIIDTISATGSVFGANHISAILRGSRLRKVIEAEHDRLPTFGLARSQSSEAVSEVIQALQDSGLLETATGTYRSLMVSASGRNWRGSGERLTVRLKAGRSSATSATKVRRSRGAAATSRSANGALFAELKALRLEIAREIGKPAFVVFTDATLDDMADKMPTTLSQMSLVKGVGLAKLHEYGARFLAAIKSHAG